MTPNNRYRKIHKTQNTRLKRVIQELNGFLEGRHNGQSPLLVAVSGGGDSLALLYALMESPFKKFVQIVHVDHQWREESGQEAQKVGELAESLEVPCHILQVEKVVSEDGARNQRLAVFKNLLNKIGAQAVLLAHHRGDLAETTFKRLMEGAALPKLAAIRPVSMVEGVTLWRPLLGLDKGDLNVTPITQDATNDDPAFYRGLLRTRIFPYLEKALRRPLSSTLAHLSSQAACLTDYLDAESAPYLQHLYSGPLGLYLDLTKFPHPYLLAHLVRRFCEAGGAKLSREGIETAVRLLQQGVANRFVEKGGDRLAIDRRRLFLFLPPPPLPAEPLLLSLGTHQYGPWTVEVEEAGDGAADGWESLWTGKVFAVLPAGEYHLARYLRGRTYACVLPKMPAFLRPHLPVVDGERRRGRSEKLRVSLRLSPLIAP